MLYICAVSLSLLGLCLFVPFGGVSAGCGGGGDSSTTIVEVTLKDSGGNEVDSGGTMQDPGELTVVFGGPMDVTSVTTPGNVTLSCGNLTPAIEVTLSPDDATNGVTGDEYTVSVEDAYKYQLLECILTITTNVRNSDGVALATPVVYTFTNACAVSDDFNADSESCWQVEGSVARWGSWSDLLANILAFDTSNSILGYDATRVSGITGMSGAIIYKSASIGDSFEIVFKASASGIDDTAPDGSPDMVVVRLSENPSWGPDGGKGYGIGFYGGSGNTNCGLLYSPNGSDTTAFAISPYSSDATYYLKMRGESSLITAQFSTDGVTYQNFDNTIGAFPTNEDFSSLRTLSILLIDQGQLDNRASIDRVFVTGISVDGQY